MPVPTLIRAQYQAIEIAMTKRNNDSSYDGSDMPYHDIAGISASLSDTPEFFFDEKSSNFSWGPLWRNGKRLNIDQIRRAFYNGRIQVI